VVWAELKLENVSARLAFVLSAKELVWEVLKLEETVQRRVITSGGRRGAEYVRESTRGQVQIAQLVSVTLRNGLR
jgi:hypothetical protein